MTERWPVRHRCGHQAMWDLSRKHPEDRPGFARWLAGRDCNRCWWANRRDPRQEGIAARRRFHQALQIITWEQATNMPPLSGSPRSVAFARKIRHHLLTRTAAGGDRARVEAAARSTRTAQWWIAHRHLRPDQLPAALDQFRVRRRRQAWG
jgi:hypothetical protein